MGLTDFSQNKNNTADIIILGSSLMLTPINLADARFCSSTIDGAIHHQSDLLKFLLFRQKSYTKYKF